MDVSLEQKDFKKNYPNFIQFFPIFSGIFPPPTMSKNPSPFLSMQHYPSSHPASPKQTDAALTLPKWNGPLFWAQP